MEKQFLSKLLGESNSLYSTFTSFKQKQVQKAEPNSPFILLSIFSRFSFQIPAYLNLATHVASHSRIHSP
jgi:hypothetical protein